MVGVTANLHFPPTPSLPRRFKQTKIGTLAVNLSGRYQVAQAAVGITYHMGIFQQLSED